MDVIAPALASVYTRRRALRQPPPLLLSWHFICKYQTRFHGTRRDGGLEQRHRVKDADRRNGNEIGPLEHTLAPAFSCKDLYVAC